MQSVLQSHYFLYGCVDLTSLPETELLEYISGEFPISLWFNLQNEAFQTSEIPIKGKYRMIETTTLCDLYESYIHFELSPNTS